MAVADLAFWHGISRFSVVLAACSGLLIIFAACIRSHACTGGGNLLTGAEEGNAGASRQCASAASSCLSCTAYTYACYTRRCARMCAIGPLIIVFLQFLQQNVGTHIAHLRNSNNYQLSPTITVCSTVTVPSTNSTVVEYCI